MMEKKDKKFLGVHFSCCNVYNRLYLNKAGTHYVGGCPKCGKRLKIGIDPRAGTRSRFFTAT